MEEKLSKLVSEFEDYVESGWIACARSIYDSINFSFREEIPGDTLRRMNFKMVNLYLKDFDNKFIRGSREAVNVYETMKIFVHQYELFDYSKFLENMENSVLKLKN